MGEMPHSPGGRARRREERDGEGKEQGPEDHGLGLGRLEDVGESVTTSERALRLVKYVRLRPNVSKF